MITCLQPSRPLITFITLTVTLAACGSPASPDESIDLARQLHADGDMRGAVAALRNAIRQNPGDSETRLLLAEVYVDLGEGRLAITAIEQAEDRGLAPERAALLQARALFVDGRYRALLEFDSPENLSAVDALWLHYLRSEAHARQSGVTDGSDDVVVEGFVQLFSELAGPNGAEAREIAEKLEADRPARPDIERAWQHFRCEQAPAEPVGWRPLERPGARVVRVGANRDIKTIAEAARAAKDGDIVEIDSGMYPGGVAVWPQNRLIVRGADERPLITADGKTVRRRDVWLFTGDDVVVENVEISGARSRWKNGAAIRHIGAGLTLRHVFLHDNENGLLTGNRHRDTNTVLIEFSEFARNGDGEGFAHNIYIGHSKRFELRYSFSHESRAGHLVKSRAGENVITYNRLTDGEAGSSSYVIDVAEGGVARIVGNMLEQGPGTLNHGMISYAAEGSQPGDNSLVVVNNSIYNRDFEGIAVRNHAELPVQLVNNLFGGATMAISGPAIELVSNLNYPDHGMADPREYDYSLEPGTRAVDSGNEFAVVPAKEYVHPVRWRERDTVWRIDVGAYERCGIDQ